MIRIKNPFPPRLPSEYQEVEYIESSGTQYIDTGFKPNQDTKVVMDVQSVGVNTSDTGQSFFGARNGSAYRFFTFWHRTNNAYYLYYNNTSTSVSSDRLTNRMIVTMDKNNLSIGGIVSTSLSYATFDCAQNMFLFATNLDGTADYFGVNRVYSCKIYDNDILARNYVPCYRKSDNVAGLYDLVNGTFYTNAGTGTFLMGTEANRGYVNIHPIIGGKSLLERYIGNSLVYKSGPSYTDIDFSSCPFPTSWTKGADYNNYSALNNYGNWSIYSSSYYSTQYTIANAFDGNTNTTFISKWLSSSTTTTTVELISPILIKPTIIRVKHLNFGTNSIIEGYDEENSTWDRLCNPASSGNEPVTHNFTITTEKFYNKFKITMFRVSSSRDTPNLYEFQITSGIIRQEV